MKKIQDFSKLFIIIALISCQATPSNIDSKNSDDTLPGHTSAEVKDMHPIEINQRGSIKITGEIGPSNHKRLKIYETEGKDFFVIDSCEIVDEKFSIVLNNILPGIYKIGLGRNTSVVHDLILNPAEKEIEIAFQNNVFSDGKVTSNSKENEALLAYRDLENEHKKKVRSLRKSSASSQHKRQAILQADANFKSVQNKIATDYPNTFFSNYVSHLQSSARFDKSAYWDDIDFHDESLIHSPMYPKRIEDYMRNIASKGGTEADPKLGFYNAVDEIANKIKNDGGDEVLSFVLYTMAEGFYSSNMEELSSYVIDNYFYGDACGDAEISELFKMKAAGIRALQIGSTPPNFTVKGLRNTQVDLYKTAGQNQLTLLLFWSSTCHKCEREIPEIKSLYEQYKNKSFEIIAVSVDTDYAQWALKVSNHNGGWLGVCDGEGWRGKIAKDFRVTSTPVMYLINAKKEIIAKPKNYRDLGSSLSILK